MDGGLQYLDIDQRDIFDHCLSQIETPSVPNFVVRFDDDSARCATSLSQINVTQILEHRRGPDSQGECLWLNLWGWSEEHYEIVKLIAHEYDVSPRLAHVICPKPNHNNGTSNPVPPAGLSLSNDVEKAQSTTTISHSDPHSETASTKKSRLSGIDDVVNDLWHFYSLGFGQRHISVSWNSLFFLPDGPTPSYSSKPNAIRVWSSLLLCDDGTILSVFESPSSCPPDVVRRIRSNQLNIFRHLTKSLSPSEIQNPLMQISIRSSSNRSKSSRMDLASLMLYYLFDDWVNIYTQAAGGTDSYRHRLDRIREQMIVSPDVNQVKTLHALGRQLIVLKSIYRSYQVIIERVTQSLQTRRSHHISETAQGNEGLRRTTTSPLTRQDSIAALTYNDLNADETQIRMSQNVITRFERLLDRIEICALTEVEECLKEKESMVLMNFNLIQLAESRAVERLTGITVLLAKVTILFLPLSLVSGYFSLQFAAIDELYSLKTFWLTFLVVAVVTILFLAGFSVLGALQRDRVVRQGLAKDSKEGGTRFLLSSMISS